MGRVLVRIQAFLFYLIQNQSYIGVLCTFGTNQTYIELVCTTSRWYAFVLECPLGTYGLDCNATCSPGYFGYLCTSVCDCPADQCDRKYGCTINAQGKEVFVKSQRSGEQFLNVIFS